MAVILPGQSLSSAEASGTPLLFTSGCPDGCGEAAAVEGTAEDSAEGLAALSCPHPAATIASDSTATLTDQIRTATNPPGLVDSKVEKMLTERRRKRCASGQEAEPRCKSAVNDVEQCFGTATRYVFGRNGFASSRLKGLGRPGWIRTASPSCVSRRR